MWHSNGGRGGTSPPAACKVKRLNCSCSHYSDIPTQIPWPHMTYFGQEVVKKRACILLHWGPVEWWHWASLSTGSCVNIALSQSPSLGSWGITFKTIILATRVKSVAQSDVAAHVSSPLVDGTHGLFSPHRRPYINISSDLWLIGATIGRSPRRKEFAIGSSKCGTLKYPWTLWDLARADGKSVAF